MSVAVSNPSAESYALSWRTARASRSRRCAMCSAGAACSPRTLPKRVASCAARPGLDRPDLQLTFMVGMKESARMMPRAPRLRGATSRCLRPSTRGRLELGSADPAAKPVMRPRFLEDRADVETLDRADCRGPPHPRRCRRSARYAGAELLPGRDAVSDAELEASSAPAPRPPITRSAPARWDPARDPMAVVDNAASRAWHRQACAWPMRRSCRTSSAATPARRR